MGGLKVGGLKVGGLKVGGLITHHKKRLDLLIKLNLFRQTVLNYVQNCISCLTSLGAAIR